MSVLPTQLTWLPGAGVVSAVCLARVDSDGFGLNMRRVIRTESQSREQQPSQNLTLTTEHVYKLNEVRVFRLHYNHCSRVDSFETD